MVLSRNNEPDSVDPGLGMNGGSAKDDDGSFPSFSRIAGWWHSLASWSGVLPWASSKLVFASASMKSTIVSTWTLENFLVKRRPSLIQPFIPQRPLNAHLVNIQPLKSKTRTISVCPGFAARIKALLFLAKLHGRVAIPPQRYSLSPSPQPVPFYIPPADSR